MSSYLFRIGSDLYEQHITPTLTCIYTTQHRSLTCRLVQNMIFTYKTKIEMHDVWQRVLRVCSSIVSSGKSLTSRTCSIIVVREIIYRHSIIKYIYIGIIIINCTYYDLTLLFFSNPNSKKDEGLKFGTAKIICYLYIYIYF